MPTKSTKSRPAATKRASNAATKRPRQKAASRVATKTVAGTKRPAPSSPSLERRPEPTTASPSKQAQLIALLRSPSGGTIASMTALTGWQAHTVRGTISGVLRKKLQLNVICTSEGDGAARVYRIVEA